jgi:hypothetical protein
MDEGVRPCIFLLQLAAAFHGLQHRDFVGVFDITADGDAHGDAGDFHADALELLREIGSGRFAFNGRIRREDDFVDVAGVDPRQEISDAKLLGANAVQGRDGSVEDMVDAVEVLGLVDGGDVGGLFDDADQTLVARGAGAVDAGVDVGDVVADRAQTQAGLDVAHGGGEGLGIVFAGAKNVEGEALRGFCSDAGEFLQLVDEARHGFGKFGHGARLGLGDF